MPHPGAIVPPERDDHHRSRTEIPPGHAPSRLSQRAVAMAEAEAEAWTIADRVADALEIDRSRFEKPQMHEESLFEYRLGMHTVQYRRKDSDPLNRMYYTRSLTLKATSPTTAVLVRYSNRSYANGATSLGWSHKTFRIAISVSLLCPSKDRSRRGNGSLTQRQIRDVGYL